MDRGVMRQYLLRMRPAGIHCYSLYAWNFTLIFFRRKGLKPLLWEVWFSQVHSRWIKGSLASSVFGDHARSRSVTFSCRTLSGGVGAMGCRGLSLESVELRSKGYLPKNHLALADSWVVPWTRVVSRSLYFNKLPSESDANQSLMIIVQVCGSRVKELLSQEKGRKGAQYAFPCSHWSADPSL